MSFKDDILIFLTNTLNKLEKIENIITTQKERIKILEAKIDSTLENYSDLSYFFGPGADSVQVDPVQYPDKGVIERCAVIRDFSNKEDLEKVLEMWSRVKGDNLNTGIVLIIFAVFGALFVWLVVSKVNKYRRQKQRKHYRRRKPRK